MVPRATRKRLRQIDDRLCELGERAALVEVQLEKIVAAVEPRPKSRWKRLAGWIGASLVGVVGTYIAVPPEYRIDRFFELRRLQADLRHYRSFVPDRCEEVASTLGDLQLKVARPTLEFATIAELSGRCARREAGRTVDPESRHGHLETARHAYWDAFASSLDPPRSVWRWIAVRTGARLPVEEALPVRAAIELSETSRQLAGFRDLESLVREAGGAARTASSLRPAAIDLLVAAASAQGNVLNTRQVLSLPDYDELFRAVPHHRFASAALRVYEDAYAVSEGSSAIRRRAAINLALQHLVVASHVSKQFGRLYLAEPIPAATEEILGHLRRAQELLEEARTLDSLDAQPTTPIAPNYAIGYRGLGVPVRIRRLADSLKATEIEVGANLWKEKAADKVAQFALWRGVQIGKLGIDTWAESERWPNRLGAVDSLRQAAKILASLRTADGLLPHDVLTARARLGMAFLELGEIRDPVENLRNARWVLGSALHSPDRDGSFLFFDFENHVVLVRSSAPGEVFVDAGSDDIEAQLALYNLGIAYLRGAAVDDPNEMLAGAVMVVGWLGSPLGLDSYHIDKLLIHHTAAIVYGLAAIHRLNESSARFVDEALQEAIRHVREARRIDNERELTEGTWIVRR